MRTSCAFFCMKKSDKPILVEELAKAAKEARSVTFLDYQGMNNAALAALRREVKKAGGKFVVAKNTLLKRAIDQLTAYSSQRTDIESGLQGPTAVVFATEDELAPLQVLAKSIKDTELPKLKFGLFGSDFFDTAQLTIMSQLPGKNVLQGQLVGALSAPQYMLVGALQANINKLVYILNQRAKQGGD